jgi:hypothetical protein
MFQFISRQTRDSHMSQLYDPNFSGDASSCGEAFCGLQENRTRRPKLKTKGCTNPGRQASVTTIFLGWCPNICEFSVRILLHAVFWGPEILNLRLLIWKKNLHASIRRLPLRVTPLPLHCSPSPCHPTLHCLRRRRLHYTNRPLNRM